LWETQTNPAVDGLYSVYFIDLNKGWIVGSYGTIITTTNGGINWTSQESRTGYDLNSVYFTDSNTGWAVGRSGTILHTTNGGATLLKKKCLVKYLLSFYSRRIIQTHLILQQE